MIKREKPRERSSYDPQKIIKKLEGIGYQILEAVKQGKIHI